MVPVNVRAWPVPRRRVRNTLTKLLRGFRRAEATTASTLAGGSGSPLAPRRLGDHVFRPRFFAFRMDRPAQ
jgi:hypothetical protein